MSKTLKNYQRRIAELEENNQHLQQQLAEAQQHAREQSRELQKMRAEGDRSEVQKKIEQQAIAIDKTADGIAILKEEKYIYLNAAHARLLGYDSPEELLGKSWQVFYDSNTVAYFQREVMPVVAEYGSWQGEALAIAKDGRQLTQELSLNLTEDGLFICIFRDITQRKQAELALQQLNEELEQRVAKRTRELHDSQTRFQRLAANLPGVIFQFRLAADGTPSFPYVSEGSRKIYELEPENFLQAFDWVHPSDLDGLNGAIEESIQTLERFQHEYRIITPSGILKWLQIISQPERQEDGATVWDGLVIEIGDRKHLEQEQQRLLAILENTPDIIGIADPQGNNLYLNRAGQNLFEITPDEIDRFHINDYATPDTQVTLAEEAIPTAIATGMWQGESHLLAKGGREFTVSQVIVSHNDEDGNIECLSTSLRDISDRKAVEAALSESEERFRLICEQTGQLVYDWDIASGKITWAGAIAAMTGYTMEEFASFDINSWECLIHLDDRDRVTAYLEQSMAEGSRYRIEYRWQQKSGNYIDVEDIGVFLTNEKGEVSRMLGTTCDISDRKRTEERLRLQEEQYRQVFETSTDGLGIVDLETVALVKVNPAYHQMHGYAYEEFIAMPIAHYVHPDSLPILARFVEEIQAGRSFFSRGQNIHRDGTTIDLDIKGIPFPYRGKTHALAILRDISAKVRLERDRDRQERALQEKEALLQTTLEAGKLGCWCWNRHTDTIIWSDGIESVLGLYAVSFGNTLDDYLELIHSEDREKVEGAIAHTLATGREYQSEHRLILPDGRIQWIRGTGELWRDDRGEAIGLLGSLLNDTQRKAAELALIESANQIRQQARQEQFLNQIANQIRTSLDLDRILETTVREIRGFLQVDRCHFAWYLYESESAYWNVTAEVKNPDLPGFIGKHPVASFGPLSELLLRQQVLKLDDTATIDNPILQETLMMLGNKSMLVLPVCSESGKFGIIACIHHQSVRPWRDSEIEFLEAVGAQVAIAINQAELLTQSQTRAQELEELLTKFQRTQTQLIQSEKMSSLGQMVAGVAHEINNPVSFIHGNLVHANRYIGDLLGLIELYQDFYPEPHTDICDEIEAIDLDFLKGDLQKLFQSMRVGTDRIREIVKSLRTFSRLDEAEVKNVDIHDGIDSTLMILQTRLRAQDWRPEIQVMKEYGQLPRVQCYAGQLNQVFMNILGNAIDALEERDRDRSLVQMTENPSQIRIHTEPKDDNIIIRIGDNGNGMSKETRAKLFDPFFTTKAVGKGTGLGLSISYQIVTEKHDGKLSCTSKPGETMFTIEIPAIGEREG